MHVIIDPGHGGIDTGTVNQDLIESRTASEVAQRLAAKLRRSGKFRVSLTRTDDHQVGLMDRVHVAEKLHGDVLISIHVNSSPDPKAKGAEFYFQNQLAGDEESMALAHRENTEADQAEAPSEDPAIQTHRPLCERFWKFFSILTAFSKAAGFSKFSKPIGLEIEKGRPAAFTRRRSWS